MNISFKIIVKFKSYQIVNDTLQCYTESVFYEFLTNCLLSSHTKEKYNEYILYVFYVKFKSYQILKDTLQYYRDSLFYAFFAN